MEFIEALPAFAVVAALLQPVAIVGTAVLAYRLGRGAAEEDRVPTVESSALADTRSWLLDAIEVVDAAAQRDWRRLRRLAARGEGVRYERQLAELIADDRLVDMLCDILPTAYEQLPRVSEHVRERVAQLGAEVRHSMYQQELQIARRATARRATDAQQRRLLHAAERMKAHTACLHTWRGRARMIVMVNFGWWP